MVATVRRRSLLCTVEIPRRYFQGIELMDQTDSNQKRNFRPDVFRSVTFEIKPFVDVALFSDDAGRLYAPRASAFLPGPVVRSDLEPIAGLLGRQGDLQCVTLPSGYTISARRGVANGPGAAADFYSFLLRTART